MEELFMSSLVFKSVLRPYFESYLKMKSSLEFGTKKIITVFKELDNVCCRIKTNEAILTQEMIKAWREERLNESEKSLYGKWSIICQFAKYMCNSGVPGYVPRMPRWKPRTFIPKIFTEEEIENIFSAVDSLRMKNLISSSCLFSMPALIRVLYITGMRIGEAVRLKNEDIDFDKGFILIKKTKNQQQRLIPINPSLEDILKQYLKYRNKIPIKNITFESALFFVSQNGRPISTKSAYTWFRKVLKLCGIPFLGGNKGPRLHDLRHTMAVHSLMKMIRQGMDTYCALPILSTLLGHKTIAGTEYYVRLTQEMFPDLNIKVSELSAYVFPTLNSIIKAEQYECKQ